MSKEQDSRRKAKEGARRSRAGLSDQKNPWWKEAEEKVKFS